MSFHKIFNKSIFNQKVEETIELKQNFRVFLLKNFIYHILIQTKIKHIKKINRH